MLRRTLTVALVAVLAASVSAVALASAVKNHSFSSTTRLAGISISKNFPAPGSTSLDASITDAHPGGRAAGITKVTITGVSAGGLTSFKSTGTNYTAQGLQFLTTKGTATVHADGSATLTGSGRYTGGTGLFKHLTGTFTFTGSQPSVTGVSTLKIKGNQRY
jgi:hypothetical protein